MQASLLIMAAGMGSRYGGLKQFDGFGPGQETLLEYALYDAIQAGFKKAVFVIREEFESLFQEKLISKFGEQLECHCVFQDIAPHRTKPWGTAHAVLCASSVINEPFVVLNADDYYGKEAFELAYQFLSAKTQDNRHGLVVYRLKNTLSEYGSVSRGLCSVDSENLLVSVEECTQISMNEKGTILDADNNELKADTPTSLNFWILKPNVFQYLDVAFKSFLEREGESQSAEIYLPFVLDRLISSETARVQTINTQGQWMGVTYAGDKAKVAQVLADMVAKGQYPSSLWG